MRILLVIPKRNTYFILPAPDIGVAYIARAALNAGAEVEVLDAHKDNIPPQKFKDFLKDKHYDLIAFKCLSIDVYKVLEYCRIIKECNEDTVTVLGGPHPSALPEHTLRSLDVDYVIRGEGELGITLLLKDMMSFNGRIPSNRKEKIPCLAYRDDDTGSVRLNPIVFEEKLDNLNFPAWHLFKIKEYPQLPGPAGKFLPVITSRGCPSICTFCSSDTIHGRRIRTRSPEHVIEEIKWIVKNFNLQQVSIFDNNFTFYKEHVMRFCDLYMKNEFPVKFDVPQGVRLDRIDKDIVKMLDKAGCIFMGIGVESGLQETLKVVKKATTPHMIEEKVRMIKENSSMEVMGLFILGFPHETEEMVLKTIDFALRLPIDYAAFTIFTPFPGTALFDQMIREGYFALDELNWEGLLLDRVTFKHKKIDADRLKKLQKKAYLRFYFRPSKVMFFTRIMFQEFSFMAYLRRFISILTK